MRYILNSEGYIYDISFGADISCSLGNCALYTGEVPADYETIEEWFEGEQEKLNAWKIVEDNLVFDNVKYAELQIQYEEEARKNEKATVGFVEDTLNNSFSPSNLEEMLPVKTAEGTIVKIPDASNSKAKQIDIYKASNGSFAEDFNIYIQSKNMLVNDATSKNECGISFEVNDDRSIKVNGTAENDIEFNIAGTETNTKPLLVLKKDEDYCLSGLGVPRSIEGKGLTIPSSHQGKLTKFNIKGKSEQDGTPTPDNPIEIKNVEGNVEVKVEGKNGFNKNTVSQGYISLLDGSFTASTRFTSSDYIEIKPNINYYCNYVAFGSSSYGMAFYDKDKNYISGSVLKNIFVTPNNAKYYRFCVRNENYSDGTYITDINTVQLEEGTTPTEYEPYKSQTVYFPLAEGQKLMEGSYLANDGVHNKRKQVVLNGTNDKWSLYKQIDDAYCYQVTSLNDCKIGNETSICTHFKNVAASYDMGTIGYYCDHPTLIRKYFTTNFTTVTEWIRYLSQQYSNGTPVIIEYELAEEEIVPYTEEQQEAYNQLQNIELFEGVNNISTIPSTNIECEYLEGQILKLYNYDGTDRTEVYSNTGKLINFTDENKNVTQIKLYIPKGTVFNDNVLYPQLEAGREPSEYEEAKKALVVPVKNNKTLERIGLYPSDDLYPADDLYPIDDVRDLITIKEDKCYFVKKVNGNIEQKEKKTSLDSIKNPVLNYGANTIYADKELGLEIQYSRNNYYDIVEGTNILHLQDTYESKGAINKLEVEGFEGTEKVISLVSSKDGATEDNIIVLELLDPIGTGGKVVFENGIATVIRTDDSTETFENAYISTFDNETYIYIKGNNNLSYKANYMLKSTFTEYFCTRTEKNASIKVTEDEINLEVRKKVGNDEIISKINLTQEEISIDANKLNINGVISANGNFSVDTDGNAVLNGGSLNLEDSGTNVIQVHDKNDPTKRIYINESYLGVQLEGHNEIVSIGNINGDEGYIEVTGNGRTVVRASGITTPILTQTSLESLKKNFEEVEDATSIVKNSEIYKYNFKSEEDTDKKHYGFVIGENYNTPDEVISKSGEGIDTYSMCSILWKAVQEQQETIEALQKEINNLKGEN